MPDQLSFRLASGEIYNKELPAGAGENHLELFRTARGMDYDGDFVRVEHGLLIARGAIAWVRLTREGEDPGAIAFTE